MGNVSTVAMKDSPGNVARSGGKVVGAIDEAVEIASKDSGPLGGDVGTIDEVAEVIEVGSGTVMVVDRVTKKVYEASIKASNTHSRSMRDITKSPMRRVTKGACLKAIRARWLVSPRIRVFGMEILATGEIMPLE